MKIIIKRKKIKRKTMIQGEILSNLYGYLGAKAMKTVKSFSILTNRE